MSKVVKNVHDSMKDLHAIGLMSDLTMREFDALRLPPVCDYTGAHVVKSAAA